MQKITVKIEGMHCDGCASRLENYLQNQKGIVQAKVNFRNQTGFIDCEDFLTVENLNQMISDAGFTALEIKNEKK